MLPASAVEETALNPRTTTTTATATPPRLVRATSFDDIEEASETALVVDEEALHFAEDRLVIGARQIAALPRLGAVELGEYVGQVRGRIDAVGVLLVQVAQDGQEGLLRVEVVRLFHQRQLRVDGALLR